MADYKLNRQVLPLSNAFYRGLTDLISPSWLKLFNASEFNQLLSGGNHDIDVDDLRNNTRYTGGYTEGSRTVKLFWEVQEVLDEIGAPSIPLSVITKAAEIQLLYTVDKVILGNRWLRKATGIQPKFPYVVDSFEKRSATSFQRASMLPHGGVPDSDSDSGSDNKQLQLYM